MLADTHGLDWWQLMAERLRESGRHVGARHGRLLFGSGEPVNLATVRQALDALNSDDVHDIARRVVLRMLWPKLTALQPDVRTEPGRTRYGWERHYESTRRKLVGAGAVSYADIPAYQRTDLTDQAHLQDVYIEAVCDGWRDTMEHLLSTLERKTA